MYIYICTHWDIHHHTSEVFIVIYEHRNKFMAAPTHCMQMIARREIEQIGYFTALSTQFPPLYMGY